MSEKRMSSSQSSNTVTTTNHDQTINLIPSHRSHDPATNLKRADPFKFGSRYLQEDDDVFEFNAWDHVTPDEDYYTYADQQYASQRASPVTDFDKKRFNDQPEKWWNKFYSNNTSNFFKDRKWLQLEFPILSQLTKADAGPVTLLEVGAGAGNTAFPVLRANLNPHLMLHACDFSSKAVELMQADEAYDTNHMQASVWDVSGESLPKGLTEASVDVVLLVFIFSALSPAQWEQAVRNVWTLLKPGGEVCFRDYGKGDLTQVRFKKGRLLEENFYIRGDGTRVYFFEEEELRRIWGKGTLRLTETTEQAIVTNDLYDISNGAELLQNLGGSFEIASLNVDRKMLVNRRRQLKMYRCWIQGRFRKPV